MLEILHPSRREVLRAARASVSIKANVDESWLLPAWRRYNGSLYFNARATLHAALADNQPVVIISGGYGLVLADEQIGSYDRAFSPDDWPAGLLEDCLADLADHFGASELVAFCARSTGYAALIRGTTRHTRRFTTTVASPDMKGRIGAQVLVPRACGQALAAYLHGELGDGWTSSDGVPLRFEQR